MQKAAQWLLIIASFVFCAYFSVWHLAILGASILVNYLFAKLCNSSSKDKKTILIIAIFINVCALFIFKYYNFFIYSIGNVSNNSVMLLDIVIPLGISFYTFQQIAFLIDTYRGEIISYSFTDYVLFVSFFPKLVQGPIVLHGELMPQLQADKLKKTNGDNLSKGLFRFTMGLGKKVLIADTLAKGVDWGYMNITALGSIDAIIVMCIYSLQLYFDFSGYCDMACGLAASFGIELPENFNSPYKTGSIAEFWNRWHITLTRFLTKYIYIPLGGNRRGKKRTAINILLVFLISGLWHGANWTFIIWGLMHGLALLIYKAIKPWWDKMLHPLQVILNFIFVSLAWVVFRADSLENAQGIYKAIFGGWGSMNIELAKQFNVLELTYIEEHISALSRLSGSLPYLNFAIIFAIAVGITFVCKNNKERAHRPTMINALATILILVWSIVSLSGVSTFLYMNY